MPHYILYAAAVTGGFIPCYKATNDHLLHPTHQPHVSTRHGSSVDRFGQQQSNLFTTQSESQHNVSRTYVSAYTNVDIYLAMTTPLKLHNSDLIHFLSLAVNNY